MDDFFTMIDRALKTGTRSTQDSDYATLRECKACLEEGWTIIGYTSAPHNHTAISFKRGQETKLLTLSLREQMLWAEYLSHKTQEQANAKTI